MTAAAWERVTAGWPGQWSRARADLPADAELHAGKRPGDHAHGEGVDLNPLDAHDGGLVKHHLLQPVFGVDLMPDALKHLGGMAHVNAGRDGNVDHGARPVARQGRPVIARGRSPGHFACTWR